MGALRTAGIALLVIMCISAGASIVIAVVNAVRGTSTSSSSSTTTTAPASAATTPSGATTSSTSATTAPVATAVATPTCDTTACGNVIASYLAKNWAYTSSNFGECKNCPVVSYPNKLPS